MSAIVCPVCGHGCDEVVSTERQQSYIRRRRQCVGCGQRVTTYESTDRPALATRPRTGRDSGRFRLQRTSGGR